MNLIPQWILHQVEGEGYAPIGVSWSEAHQYPMQAIFVTHPDFWRSLGRARKWPSCPQPDLCRNEGRCNGEPCPEDHALRFLKILIYNPSQEAVDRFWAELL